MLSPSPPVHFALFGVSPTLQRRAIIFIVYTVLLSTWVLVAFVDDFSAIAVAFLIVFLSLLSCAAFAYYRSLSIRSYLPLVSQPETSYYSERLRDNIHLALVDRDFTSEDYESLLALDESIDTTVFQGATEAEIRRLPGYVYMENANNKSGVISSKSSSEKSSCSICLESFNGGDLLRILPCLHQFHQSCVDQWLPLQASCPVCKYPAVV
eukprot:GILJ01009306.1.p1 GENE.GILJ01009306.1~~GILJ01009306.1.p1  ORF type:complete len:210 (+),score=12.43 GILJ01009306.1:80-709(+)